MTASPGDRVRGPQLQPHPPGPGKGLVPLPQLLLILIGVTCLVAGTWNLPRHRENLELERERQRLEAEVDEWRARTEDVGSRLRAFDHDPHYRRELLRLLSGQNIAGETPLDDWLQGRGSRGAPSSAN